MHFLIDLSVLDEQENPSEKFYLQEIFREMAASEMQDVFTWILKDTSFREKPPTNVNVHIKASGRWFFTRYLENNRIKKLARKTNADLIIYINRVTIPLAKKPYVVLVTTLERPQTARQERIYANCMADVFSGAKKIITTFSSLQEEIKSRFSVAAVKITALRAAPLRPPQVLSWDVNEEVKNRFTGGTEYFLYAGDIGMHKRLFVLLKAFSQFKKWQRSSMQLVIAGSSTSWTSELSALLGTYKYRDDVKLITDPREEEVDLLIGASYCLVVPGMADDLFIEVIKAVECGVPVILSSKDKARELVGDAALFAESEEQLGAAMQTIYKDEKLRSKLIEEATVYSKQWPRNTLQNDLYKFLVTADQ